MPKNFFSVAALVATLLPALSWANPFTLGEALDLAVQRSEAVRAMRAGVLGATEAARSAAQLPDPVLRVGIDNMPVSGGERFSTRDAMTMKRIGVAQEWLSAEKRTARQAVADATVSRETATLLSNTADVRLQTGLTYLDAYFAGEALKLTLQSVREIQEELAVARGRQSSASGSAQEVLALTAALGIAEDESAEVLQQQSAAIAALERWVGVQADVILKAPVFDAVTEQRFVEGHPATVSAQRDAALAHKEVDLARVNRSPNWSWEVSYGQRAGYPDMVSVGVSIPIAIAPYQRQDRDIASKVAVSDKADATLAEAVRMASGEYRVLISEATRLRDRDERFRAAVVVPARQRTEVVLAGYRSGQTALTVIFEARQAELQAQRRLLLLQRDLARTLAQLALKPVVTGVAP